ncbi:MAG: MG2 domain-containing protein [Clostridium sp.]|nr:MG2 domain-containing protein [Clostridium sp.]
MKVIAEQRMLSVGTHRMWKRLVGWTLMMTCAVSLSAQTYDKMWEKVRGFEKRELPQSAYAEVQLIREKAVREGNAGQEMAARLDGYMLQQQVVPDSFFTSMAELERLRRTETDAVRRAVYSVVLAKLYAGNRDRSQVGSQVIAAHPDSLREWSRAQYDSATVANSRQAMEAVPQLLAARAKTYLPFVIHGKDAAYFKGDLLNVVGRWVMQTLSGQQGNASEAVETARQCAAMMLKAYRAEGNREAELLVMLDSIALEPVDRPDVLLRGKRVVDDEKEDSDDAILNDTTYLTYRAMLERFADSPLAAEIYIAMLRLPVTSGVKVEWAREALRRYPSYMRKNYFEITLADLQHPSFQWEREGVYYPLCLADWIVTARNITHLEVEIYKVGSAFDKDRMLSLRQPDTYVRKMGTLADKFIHAFDKRPAHEEFTDTLHWLAPEVGRYAVIMHPVAGMKTENGTRTACNVLLVSRMKMLTQSLPDGQTLCTVVDARDGSPVTGADVTVYRERMGNRTLEREVRTDERGQVLIPAGNEAVSYILAARKGNDIYLPETTCGGRTVAWSDDAHREDVALYTDRGIYRPGQTVNVSGIAYAVEGESRQALAKKEVKLALRDTNGKIVEEQTVRTDEYGVVAADFILPERSALGYYSIEATGERIRHTLSVRVEEYKRPTFRIEFDEVKERYAAGDTVTVTGVVRTFAGAPCRQARVTGHGQWHQYMWRYAAEPLPAVRLDTLYTDENGRFVWRVPLEVDSDRAKLGCYLRVSAEALSVSGETQRGDMSLPLGNTPLRLSVVMDERQDRDRMQPWTFNLNTLNGAMVNATVNYALYPDSVKDQKQVEPLLEAQAASNKSFSPDALRSLPSGRYRLCASVVVDGDTAECNAGLVLFGMDDKRPVSGTDFWYYCPTDTFDANTPARIQVGSSFHDVSLYYYVLSDTHLLESGLTHFSDSLITVCWPYREEYGDGITVGYAFVKDNRLYQYQKRFVRPASETKLTLSWSTFRDKLQPGGQEEWRLRVIAPDGAPARANLMATLYDTALDRLTGFPVSWNLWLPGKARPYLPMWQMQYVQRAYSSLYFRVKYQRVGSLSFDRFDDRFFYGMYANRVFYSLSTMARGVKMSNYMSAIAEDASDEAVNAVSEKKMGTAPRAAVAGTVEAVEEEDSGVQDMLQPVASMRTDFRETAFFYPSLRTDTLGEVSLVFTLPESLTTWRFIGLAHTREMNVGTIEATAVAQKDFMVQLHVPRFVRVGDRVALKATLTNLTDRRMKGKACLEVFDPVSEKVVYSSRQSFDTEDASVLSFELKIDGRYDLLACRIVAEGDAFSDGEQHYLPVLSDKTWVTESVDVRLTGQGEKTVDLTPLTAGQQEGERPALTVEYTTTPVWYALQTLPALDNPSADDALSVASAYYGAAVAAHIALITPRLQTVIEAWKAKGGTAETLWSNLRRDETLKGILLSETPWVLQADNEENNRRNLAGLFDVNRQTGRRIGLLRQLREMQRSDGSFAWFPGMEGNEYITREVAGLLVRQRVVMGGRKMDDEVDRILRPALAYLKKINTRRVADMRKAEREGARIAFPGEAALHYLYITAMADKSGSGLQGKDEQYLLARLAQGNGEVNNEQRALAAVVLSRAGRSEAALQFVASLREHMARSESRGVYFEYPGGSFTSIDRKLAVHVQAMEAVYTVTPDEQTLLSEMSRWLLQQKRVQSWDTPVNSANAVFALLQGGCSIPAVKEHDALTVVTGKAGGKARQHTTVTGDETAAGLGYVKQTFVGDKMAGAPLQLVVDKAADAESWGCVTLRSLVSLDKLKASSTGLTVRREMSTSAPRVGDKLVVRYVITADRDYEYVVLKESRPACCEPLEARSGYMWRNGLGCYRMVRDAATEYYIDRLPKGTYVIESEQYVEREGSYAAGPAVLQCVYAAGFTSHTANQQITVRKP